jgi:hypothetical protein
MMSLKWGLWVARAGVEVEVEVGSLELGLARLAQWGATFYTTPCAAKPSQLIGDARYFCHQTSEATAQ